MNRARLLPAAALSLLLLLVASVPAAAQDAGARLRGLVFDSTTMQPLPGAMVVVLGTSVKGTTDDAGRFTLDGIPAGRREVSFLHGRIQTLGVSPPLESLDFRAGQTSDVLLALPSEETLLEAWCLVEAQGSGVARLAGVVRDTLTGVPLPSATVTVQPLTAIDGQPRGTARVVKTDETGYYRICDAPVGPASVHARFGLSGGLQARVELRPDRPRVLDLRMIISQVGRLQGQVTDYATGEPVAGASISLVGSEEQRLTDAQGRFVLDSIPPGMQAVHTAYLGYEPTTDSVTVFNNEAVEVDIRLTTEAIAIPGMVVTARGQLGMELVDVGRRLDYMGRMAIEEVLPRVRDMHDLLSEARFPAIDVREMNMPNAAGGNMQGLCIEAVRRQRQAQRCQMVLVVIDGVPMSNAPEALQSYPPEAVQTIRFVSPMDATTSYGSAGANGVLEITTRR